MRLGLRLHSRHCAHAERLDRVIISKPSVEQLPGTQGTQALNQVPEFSKVSRAAQKYDQSAHHLHRSLTESHHVRNPLLMAGSIQDGMSLKRA